DQEEDDPGTERELGDGDLERDDAGRDGTDAVDERLPAPTLDFGAQSSPVPDHAGLAQREGDEYADGVQGDEGGDAAREEQEQHCRDRGEDHDAAAEREPIAPELERPRQEAV